MEYPKEIKDKKTYNKLVVPLKGSGDIIKPCWQQKELTKWKIRLMYLHNKPAIPLRNFGDTIKPGKLS